MKRLFLIPALAFAALALSAPAQAQSAGWRDADQLGYAQRPYLDSQRAAYDNGFREGLRQGERDGRRNNAPRYQDERTYQRADNGYHRQYGSIERYRQSFRSGYSAGYHDAYRRYARNTGYGGYGRQDSRPGYSQYPGDYGGYGRHANPALQNGLNDGYEKGVEDARKNRSYDPRRHSWYRSGDRHYDRDYGSRELYKDIYRRGFTDGYDRGYREGRYR
jgi:flagellar biosynthesis/type III secretory pathway protein FliH